MRGAGFIDPLEESRSLRELPIVSQAFLMVLSRSPILMFVLLVVAVYVLITGAAFHQFLLARAFVIGRGWRVSVAGASFLMFLLAAWYLVSFFTVRHCLSAFDEQVVKDPIAETVVLRYKTRYCAWRNCRQWLEFAVILLLFGGLGLLLTI
ncbi:MAG: hypothetical protein ACM3NH_05000 [Candidatus Saccharibacteria bacterium]